MNGNDKLEKRKRTTRNICVLITVVFIIVMLILPLFSIIVSSLKEGVGFYIKAVTTSYVLSALKVTFIATFVALFINTLFGIIAAWVLTRFDFKGKQVLATLIDIPFSISPVIVGLAFLMTFGRLGFFYPVIRWFNEIFGTNIRIAFAVPGVVLATIFVTFPYVSREIIPVLNSLGKDEEEAAALMGADGFTIFFKITLPNIKWSLIYGIILCTSRALGEFGAVNALSKTPRTWCRTAASGTECPAATGNVRAWRQTACLPSARCPSRCRWRLSPPSRAAPYSWRDPDAYR